MLSNSRSDRCVVRTVPEKKDTTPQDGKPIIVQL